jgi:hypothetical protein
VKLGLYFLPLTALPYAVPAAAKDTLLRTLHELQDRLKLCIVVERL